MTGDLEFRKWLRKMQPHEQSEISSAIHDHRHVRVSSYEKTNAVLRLLKGESAHTISSELGVTVGRLERWKSSFVAAGSAELAKRKDVSSNSWVTKHLGSIRQWIWLLLALAGVITILAVLMERSPGE
jgi:hypothetical protein